MANYMKNCPLCGHFVNGTPIDELGLSGRMLHCMYRNGIRYVEQIANLHHYERMQLRGFGENCNKELNEKLEAYQ